MSTGRAAARAAGKLYDLTIYGATGFTGTLVAEYLAVRGPRAGVRWAVAGRDAEKLHRLVTRLKAEFPTAGEIGVIVASTKEAELVAKASKVVLTTAGPFALYGEPLVAACIEHKADYCDLTGETPWMAMMLSKYEAAAAKAGVTLVNMSGFDSVPADAGTFFLADAARRRLGMGVHKVQAFMSGTGTISGGTIASGLNIARQPAMKAMVADPFLLFPAEQVARAGTGSPTTLVVPAPDVAFPTYRPDFDSTAVPFIMAAINTRIVRRTNGLLAAHSKALAGHPHMLPALPAGAAVSAPRYSPQAVAAELLASEGNVVPGPATSPSAAGSGPVSRGGSRPSSKLRSSTGPETAGAPAPGTAVTLAYSPHYPFAYTEAMLVPVRGRVLSYLAGLLTALVMALVNLAMASPLLVGLMSRFVPAPGTGGSRQQMARSWFHYDLIGTADDTRQTVAVRVSGGDGGYADTARMPSEAGILLALERASLPATAVGGGFLTPAVAFGRRLIEVLGPAGITFEVLSAGPTPPPVVRLREKGRNPGVSAAGVGAGSSTGAASSTAGRTA